MGKLRHKKKEKSKIYSPPLLFKSSGWRCNSGLLNIDSGWAAVVPGAVAAPGVKPRLRSAAEAEVGTGSPAAGPSPGSPGSPGWAPSAVPGGSCWACICCSNLDISGLCCCNPRENRNSTFFYPSNPIVVDYRVDNCTQITIKIIIFTIAIYKALFKLHSSNVTNKFE